MAANHLLYSWYERQLLSALDRDRLPGHVGVILDGNRRWAKAFGSTTADGHRRGAAKLIEFLEWSREVGVPIVTVWLLSLENLVNRPAEELDALVMIISDAVDAVAELPFTTVKVVGAVDQLPAALRDRVVAAERRSANIDPGAGEAGGTVAVNLAVGYSGRTEIVDAVRELLREKSAEGLTCAQVADALTVDDITAHLYTRGTPDPDLVIRTSGEQRLSGFMLWQSAHSEYYFCEAFWPDFRRVDYLRALRAYGQRERRLGG